MGGNPAHTYIWTSSPAGFSSNLAKPIVNPSVTTNYYLAVSNGVTTSYDTVVISVNSTLTPSVNISTKSLVICEGTNVTFNATPLYEGSTPTYQWMINGSAVNNNGLTFTTASLKNGDLVSLQMTSSAGCASTPTVLSNTIAIKVDTLVNPSVTISQSPATICNGSTVTLTAMPVNGGINPTYQWQVNGQNAGSNSNIFTFKPVFASQQLRIIMTSSACAASPTVTSNTLNVLVTQPVTPSVSITVPTTTICPGIPITFIASQTNGEIKPVYQWQKNGVTVGSDSTAYTTASIADGNVITVKMTSNAPCVTVTQVTSTPITMRVKTIYPSVTISATTTTICANAPVSFTANGLTGGTSLKYQWKKNGVNVGTNSTTYSTTTLINGDKISVEFTSIGNCPDTIVVTSAPIIITVIPILRPTISISGVTTITQGTTVTLSSNVINKAPSFAYQWRDSTATHGWQDIPSAVNADLTYMPLASGDRVICTFKNFSGSCLTDTTVTSNVLVFTVTPTAIVSLPANEYGIKYYPNPVQTELIIENLRISDKWETFDVMSIEGKQKILTLNCRNQDRMSVNLQILKQGTYLGILHSKTGLSVYMAFLKMQ